MVRYINRTIIIAFTKCKNSREACKHVGIPINLEQRYGKYY